MSLYGVVIFDLVGSRRSDKRNELQLRLNNNIIKFNGRYKEMLAAPAGVTLGDEWQVITHKPAKIYDIVEAFQRMFWNDDIELYAGMGIGPLSTSLDNDLRNMDGPCFHHARQAVESAKKDRVTSKRKKVYFSVDETGRNSFKHEIAATSEELSGDINFLNSITLNELVNIIIENNEILKNKMTFNQKKIYLDYLKYGSYRKIVEQTEKKSISNISKRLNSAEVFTIKRNGEVIESLLAYYCLLERS
ncbi:MAG: hypothetical protein KGZ79_02125 [Dethiobacter sp.]|jgi:hypothetical protein|nr:hypothetical protein [Dethiobacter sp.]